MDCGTSEGLEDHENRNPCLCASVNLGTLPSNLIPWQKENLADKRLLCVQTEQSLMAGRIWAKSK